MGEVAGVRVYLVSGEQIRNADIDFTLGGNEAAYAYVPTGEIWIDDAAHVLDRTTTALHELIERDLMLRLGMDYDHAHDAANVRERAFRRDLVRQRPAHFNLSRVADAYRAYLAAQHPASRPVRRSRSLR